MIIDHRREEEQMINECLRKLDCIRNAQDKWMMKSHWEPCPQGPGSQGPVQPAMPPKWPKPPFAMCPECEREWDMTEDHKCPECESDLVEKKQDA